VAPLDKLCPACRGRSKAVFRALCPNCWRILPHPVAVEHNQCWRFRVSRPRRYQESLATVLLIIREKRAGNGGAAA
jgi:predicted amidophosphoribosyltransferase